MSFWEFLLWAFVAYLVYSLFAGGEVDKQKLKKIVLDGMRAGFNPQYDAIMEALNDHDVKKARALVVKYRAELNDPNILSKTK
jgi:hypothetical protein